MKKTIELIPFILLIIGTLGLLLNEFVFEWAKPLHYPLLLPNVIGLLALGYIGWMRNRDK